MSKDNIERLNEHMHQFVKAQFVEAACRDISVHARKADWSDTVDVRVRASSPEVLSIIDEEVKSFAHALDERMELNFC